MSKYASINKYSDQADDRYLVELQNNVPKAATAPAPTESAQEPQLNKPASSVQPSTPTLPQTDMLGEVLGLNRPQKSLESKLYARSDEGKAETSMRQKILNLQAERAEAEKAYKTAQLGAESLQGTDSTANQNVRDARAKRDAIEEQLVAIDPNLGTPTLKERVENTLSGTLKGAAGTTGTGIAFMGDWGRYGTEDSEDYALAEGAFNVVDDDYRKRMEQEAQVSQNIREESKKLTESSASELARAKQGLGAGGRLAVDVVSTGVQIASDALMNLLTGGIAGTAAMGLRSFGGAVEQAQADGATMNETMAYATATGAKDIILNKLLGGLGRVYGDSKTGKAIASMIDNYAGSPSQKKLLSTALNALSEGGEEIAEAVVGNALKSIYNDKGMLENVTDEELGDYLYEGLIGAILGGATESIGSIADGRRGNAGATATAPTASAEINGAQVLADTALGKTETMPNEMWSMEEMLASGRINNTTANAIIDNPEMAAAFTRLSGISLDGTKEQNRTAIQSYARERAYAKEQSNEAAMQAATEAETEQALRDSGYGSYMRGVLKDGVNANEARDIMRNPELRSLWEQMAGKKLPNNEKSALKMIMQTRRKNPAIPEAKQNAATVQGDILEDITNGKLAEAQTQPQSASTDVGNGLVPPAQAEAATGRTGELNSVRKGMTAEEYDAETEELFEMLTARQSPPESARVSVRRRGKPKSALPTTSDAAEMASMGTGASPYEAQIAAYGAIPKGENPARDVSVPAQVGEGTKVSRSARTIMEAEATPEAVLPQLQGAVMDGKLSYVPVSNQKLADAAANKIAEEGWEKALQNWRDSVLSGKRNAEIVAMGAQLLNNAGNAAKLNAETYLDLVGLYQEVATDAAQALYAQRILKTLTPSGKLYMVERSIKKIMEDAEGRYNVSLDPKLAEKYLAQKDDAGRDKVMDEIKQSIADQIPATLGEKWNAWRYLSMLGNLKTQTRNVIGNAASVIGQSASNRIGAMLELTLPKEQRTKSVIVPKQLLKEALADFALVKDQAMGDAKYSDIYHELDSDIQNRRTIFNNKVLERYRRATNTAMQKGDEMFSKLAYADALSGWLNARGIKSLADADERTLFEARQYAAQKAAEATFRDDNDVSELVSSWGRVKGKGAAGKTWNAFVSSVLPFRKTPANVLVRAEEYSPLGIINTGVKAIQAATGKKDVTGADVIDSLSKSLTGSALMALGYAMAAAGNLVGHEDDDELAQFKSMQGQQEYALKLDNGKTVSISWLSPLAIPLFMGAEMFEAGDGESLNVGETMLALLGSVSDPMLEMSMLGGINTLLSDLSSYGDDLAGMPKLMLDVFANYLMQGIPQPLAQLEQATQKYRQTSYTNRDSKLSSDVQYLLSKASSKIPIGDYQQQDYIDAWGRRQEQGGGFERTFNAFVNPAYTGDNRSTEVDAELERLYAAGKDIEGFPNVLPQKGSRSESLGNGERMTADEYMQYSIDRGEKSLELVSQFMGSDDYKKLDDEQRAKVISQLYSYAADRAKKTVQEAQGAEYKGDWDYAETLRDIPEYLANKTVYSEATADKKNRNYDAVDALIGDLGKLAISTRNELIEKHPEIEALVDAEKNNVGSEAYFDAKDSIAARKELVGTSAGKQTLRGIFDADLTPQEETYLVDTMASETVANAYHAFRDNGYSNNDVLDFLFAYGSKKDGSMTKTEQESYLKKLLGNDYNSVWSILYPSNK